jgi:hypothetical protein
VTTDTTIGLHRIGAKLFAENPEVIEAEPYIGIFHRWIQAQDLDGLPIDVTDYAHVPDGPGIMLIAHEADRAIDFADGRPGAVYQRKRDLEGALDERIAAVIAAADATADRLEAEPGAAGVRFGRDEIELRFHDRGALTNDDEGLSAVLPAVQAALAAVRPGHTATVVRDADDHPRAPLTLRATLA